MDVSYGTCRPIYHIWILWDERFITMEHHHGTWGISCLELLQTSLSRSKSTPPKTNMEPEHGPEENGDSFWKRNHFQVPFEFSGCVSTMPFKLEIYLCNLPNSESHFQLTIPEKGNLEIWGFKIATFRGWFLIFFLGGVNTNHNSCFWFP